MKYITATVLLATPFLAIAQPTLQQRTRPSRQYTVTDLGVLEAGTKSSGFDMNHVGWVGGSSNLTPGGPQHAFVWYGGGPLHDLGTLQGSACPQCNSGADGPNALGEIPIGSEISTPDPDGEDFCGYGTHLRCHAAIWRHGKLEALRSLPGGHNANAFGINDLGQTVGFAENGVRDPTCAIPTPFQVFRFEAVKWDANGDIQELQPLPGDTVAFSFGINDQGEVVGSSGTCATQGLPPAKVTGRHAVLWEPDGRPVYLGTLGDAAHTQFNAATSINALGDVVGTSQFTDGTIHSFLWKRGIGMQDLGTLPGAFATVAACCDTLNNRDEVVGFSIDEQGMHPFLWRDGVIVDLNTLIPADSPLHLRGAFSINDAGEITGLGCVLPECTVLHAFRATPR